MKSEHGFGRLARRHVLAMGLLGIVLAGGLHLGACGTPAPLTAPEAAEVDQVPPRPAGDDPGAAPSRALEDARAPTAAVAPPTDSPSPVPATRVVGVVTDAAGEPIVDVAVVVIESSAPVPPMAVFTDATGYYEWTVPPGTHTLEAAHDRYAPDRREVTIEPGQTLEVDFSLSGR